VQKSDVCARALYEMADATKSGSANRDIFVLLLVTTWVRCSLIKSYLLSKRDN
jgi:hypothetical protein